MVSGFHVLLWPSTFVRRDPCQVMSTEVIGLDHLTEPQETQNVLHTHIPMYDT